MRMLAIKPDHIPDAVADSMREFFHTRGDAQRAIAAALNAWPGMQRHTFAETGSGDDYTPAIDEIILPLSQEKQDAEA